MLSFMEIIGSVQEVVAAESHEIIAFVLFLISFFCLQWFHGRSASLIKKDQALRKEEALRAKKDAFGSEVSLRWARTNDSIRAKAQAAEAEMLTMLEAHEFTAALRAYRQYELEGLDRHFRNEAMYNSFVQAAVRLGKTDVLEKMLRMMRRNRMCPTMAFWHGTLKMLSSRRLYDSCLWVFESHGNMLPNDKVIFSCLINAALEHGAPEKAVPMLDRYWKCELKSAGDYITPLRVYVALHDAESAEKLFLEMEGEPTPLLLNLVLLACTNAHQPKRAMAILQKAHEMQAVAVGDVVDTISYNTVIKAFAACGQIDSCISCFKDMQKWNLKPDDATLVSLLDVSLADETGGLTDQLVLTVLETDSNLDVGTFNHFIKVLVRKDRLQNALQIYDHMRNSSQSRPTVATHAILIRAFVDSHDLEHALQMVNDMDKAGIAPDEAIFTTLLDCCRLVGTCEVAEQIFEDMLARGVKPSGYTLTMLIKLHGKCGDLEKAFKLLEGWEAEHGLKPTVIHYTCIMSGCVRNKMYDLAWAAYKLMERNGVAPDETLMTTLIPAMSASGDFDRVLHLARLALKHPGGVDVPTPLLRSVLGQMVASPGAEKEVEAMQTLMQLSGIPVRTLPFMRIRRVS